eukprot:GHVH01011685.1.p1 GENE.GHVH01011685.1~~GHVH01011685.1.p1  ORF type:complete len:559 (-),score=49.89 GHVH01011685.1:111-1787(-)
MKVTPPQSSSSDESIKSPQYDPCVHERWREQKRLLLFTIFFVFLGCVGGGWSLGGAGGVLTMPAFEQKFGWVKNCVEISDLEPLDVAGFCVDVYPTGIKFDTSTGEACLSCCCDKNADVNVNLQSGLIGSLGLWGSALGSITIGPCADFVGRKKSVIFATIIMLVGSVLSGASNDINMLLAGRALSGVSIGQLVTASPLYLSELAPATQRGIMGIVFQFGLTVGMALVALFNVYAPTVTYGWRLTFYGSGILSSIPLVALFFSPESPRWLWIRGKREIGLTNLTKLRKSDVAVTYEREIFDDMYVGCSYSTPWNPRHVIPLLFSRDMTWRTVSMFLFHFIQQMSGINAIGFFGPVIYAQFFDPVTAAWGYVGQIFFKVLALFLGMWAIDKKGRLPLLKIGSCIMTFSLIIMMLASIPYNCDGVPTIDYPDGSPPYLNIQAIGILVIAATWTYMFGFSFAWGGMPFLMTAEYLDQNCRSIGMSMCGFISWTTAGVLAQLFPYMKDSRTGLDLWGTCLFYAICTFCGTLFVHYVLMETKGFTIEELSEELNRFKQNNWII